MVNRIVAIIGDVSGSRNIRNRPAFQAKLLQALQVVNLKRKPLAGYTLIRGDEVQAAYDQPRTALHDILYLMGSISPQKIRFALGVGELTTAVGRAEWMDGPAFHRARHTIETLKKGNKKHLLLGLDAGPRALPLARASLSLLAHGVASWRPTRWQVMQRLLLEEAPSQIASELNISKVAVYKNLQAGILEEVKGFCDAFGETLAHQIAGAR
jgi:hypothetical protein